MAGNVKELTQLDFSGGVNVVTSPFLLTKRQVLRVRNMILDEHGSLSTRDGMTTSETSPDTVNPIVYRSALNRNDGTSFPYAVQNDGSVNIVRRTGTTPWTLVGTTGTAYTIPQSGTVLNTEVFAMGYETPWTWDGTTWMQITAQAGQTAPPGANHLAFHLGSLWLWNTNGTTTTLDGPSSLRMADANHLDSWPSANQTFVAKDDGQQGMGMSTYTIVETGISPTSTLVLFKNYSAYQVTGVFGSANFSVQRVKSDLGCTAPRTIQFVSGFGIIRLTHKGFALYNGVDDKLISEEVRPYIFGNSDISALNQSAIARSYAAQSQNPPLYVAACPVAGSGLSRFFIYDLVRKAWTICDFPHTVQSLNLFTTPTTTPVVHAGASVGGTIFVLFNRATNDDGVAIAWSARTRSYFVESFMRPTFWRRAVLDFEVRQTQPVVVATTLGGVAGNLAATETYTTLGATGSVYGRTVYGTGTYSAGAAATTNARQTVEINRTTTDVFLDISGAGFVRLRGISLHTVAKKSKGVYA